MIKWVFTIWLTGISLSLCAQSTLIENYYDDQKQVIKERYFVKDSPKRVIHGLYESFYQNGFIQTRGYYKNNVPDSLWIYFYENGGIKMSGNLKDGKNFGLWQFFYENGNLSMKGNIYGDEKEGLWRYYYENKQLKAEGNYEHNLKEGEWSYYFEDGLLKAKAFYKNDRGIYREFYNDGNLKAMGLNVNGKSDSTWVYYYEDGATKARGAYDEGLRHGPWVFYYKNGNKLSEGKYLKGKKDGKWIYYHENGNMSSEGALREGKKEGYWKIFDETGAFKADGIFEHGEGEYREYYESGKLKIKGHIVDNKNHGQWHYYYEDGSLEGECFFTHGTGTYTGYYKDGTIYMKGKIKEGKNVDVWEFYDPDGILAGYYRPFYEGEEPTYKLAGENNRPLTDFNREYLKPDYKYKKRKLRYFDPVVNEFRGIIISTNPFSSLIGYVPLALEYYYQERLGYEMQISYLRNPFFSQNNNINKVYSRGFDASIRQKFYHPERKTGTFYFAQEIRFTNISHRSNVLDSTAAEGIKNLKIDASENRFEYAILFGNRWLQTFGERYIKDSKSGGITIDFYIGLGIGYRYFSKNYPARQEYEQIFSDVKQNKFSLTPRVGLNFGYVF